MEANNYIPRIFDGDLNFAASKKADSSKWNAIHEATDNPGSALARTPSSIGSLFKFAWIVGIVLGLTWIMRNGKTVLTQWQQNMYRRANRRRHGIPDSDNRPFNIAYAAAALAKKEKQRLEKEKQKENAKVQAANDSKKSPAASRFRQSIPSAPTPAVSSAHNQNLPESNTYYSVNRPALPGGYPSETLEPHQNRFIQLNAVKRRPGLPVRLSSKGEGDFVVPNRERAADSTSKHAPRREAIQAASRGYKRHVNEEDDWEASLDKRARVEAASRESHEKDVEMVSASFNLEPTKGIKRDREELESTPDSGADETDESPQPRRIRQRREPAERKEIHREAIKTHKRRHSLEGSTASDEKDRDDAHVAKHRRKVVMGHDTTTESEAEDLKEYSEDPGCAGRKVGEVWEVNGQTFKVGLDGRRLRQVLVKQRRSKFPMPKDSIHTDVKADMEIFIEKWLNDQEYKAAKESHELAWQDSPFASPTNGTQELRQSTGKRLLWDGPPKSPVKSRKSIHASGVQNPFELVLSNASRRASSVHMLAGHPGENPQLKTSRSFSKWEKQDLEASSLQKMRARIEKEKDVEKPAKSLDQRYNSPLPGDGKFTFPPVTSSAASSGLTIPSTADKQTRTAVSLAPNPATSGVPTPLPGMAPTKPAPPPEKAAEPVKCMPAPFKVDNAPTPPSFNFGTAFQQPSTISIPGTAPPTFSKNFTFEKTTAAPVSVQSGKPGLSNIFSFQPSAVAGSTAAKPFEFHANPNTATPITGSNSAGPQKMPAFAPPSKENTAQPKAHGSTPAGFGFTSSISSGPEAQKNMFGNPPKPVNESAPSTTTGSTNAINPPKFTFGMTSSFPQPTSGPFAPNKLVAETRPAPPASTSASAPTPISVPSPTFMESAGSQGSNSLFGRLGSQPSTSQPGSTPFSGFGAQAGKPDQTMKPPLFTFGTKEPAESAKSTPNMFAPTTPSSEQPKAVAFPTANEPQKPMFGSPNNVDTSTSKNIFSGFPSTTQSATQAFSESTKDAFAPVSQPVSAFGSKVSFGSPSQSNFASAQSSGPKSVFGQASDAKNPFGVAPQATSTSNQSSEPPKFTFSQSSEPRSAFNQPNPFEKPSPSNLFKAPESTISAFGQISASTADAPKSIFGQGPTTAPKNIFGQSPESPKPVFGPLSTSNSAISFGNASTSASNNTLGSSGGTSSPSAGGSHGFPFTFGGGSSVPTTSTGFNNVASGNQPNTLGQPRPAETPSTPSSFTPVFNNQASAFNTPPSFAFGPNTSNPFNQPSGAPDPNSSAQPIKPTTSNTQTTTQSPFGAINFNKPS